MDYDSLKELRDKMELPDNSGKARPVRGAEADGTASLQDGKIQVVNPGHLGKPTNIKPGENVVLFVNGQLIKNSIFVTTEDEIEVYPESSSEARSLSLSVSESNLSARLVVTYTLKVLYTLLDSGPEYCLEIKAVPGRFEAPEPYTSEELLAHLRDVGVSYGIDFETVGRLAQEGGDAIVARGLPPSNGTDARIELLFSTEVFKPKVKSESADTVDILDQFDLVQVQPGDVLARKIPAFPGKPGITIGGTPLDPLQPEDAVLSTGDGAELSADGLSVIAVKAGLPQVKNNRIGVLPFYRHDGNLNAKHGHLTFDGHVLILGDVIGGVKLSATGDVLVQGSVSGAEVVAGGNLTVQKAVISANIKAGGQNDILRTIVTKLTTLCAEIDLLAGAVNQILANPSFDRSELAHSPVGYLISLLLDKKYANISKDFSVLLNICRRAGRENLRLELEACAQKFTPRNSLRFKNVQEIRSLKDLLVLKTKDLGAEINSLSNLYVNYAQNSVLHASGNILCIGKGCYDCDLYSEGEVTVIGKDGGYFRGKKIVAGGNITVADLGCPSGQEITIELAQDSKLRADFVRNNTVIKSGRQFARITEDKRLLKCWVDHKGHVNVSALRLQPNNMSKWA